MICDLLSRLPSAALSHIGRSAPSQRTSAHHPSMTSNKTIIGALEVKRCGGGGWLSGGKPCPVGTPAVSSVRSLH